MKLRIKIIKNGTVAFSNVVDSVEAGEAWVDQNAPSFGLPDRSFTLEQCEAQGIDPLTATSTSQEPIENGEITMYHFARDWSVESEDVTSQVEHQGKKSTKKEIREACMDLFDEVAITNESANDAAMDAIFLNPSFMAIVGALVSGAPKTAKRYILSLGPSLYPNEKVTDIVNKLDAIIASEGG